MPTFLGLISSHLMQKRKKKKRKKSSADVRSSSKRSKKEKLDPTNSKVPPRQSPSHPKSTGNHDDDSSREEIELLQGFRLKRSFSRPHLVQPLGNLLLLDPSSNCRNPGLGSLHLLPDHLLLDVLALLPAETLALLAAVSKSLYVFSHHDPLWRPLVLHDLHPHFSFSNSWRSTYASAKTRNPVLQPALTIRTFYSDYLYQSWLCANVEMKMEWLERDNIPRRCGISTEEFVRCFEEPNHPVLLQGCLDEWEAVRSWDQESLVGMCGDTRFSVGPVDMRLEDYFRYANATQEERPLYLFDPRFVEKVPDLGKGFKVPAYFQEDLFSLLGEERPDYRWIIIGPAGSGSSFHVDPNSTSAWNAVIKGSKKWVMFPPDVVPPGVHPSPDGADVACPVSIMEWFMNFYSACKDWKKRPVECVCKAGEVVFVPNGWWHLVYNLEDSIAITQNYVSRTNLLNVLDFLKRPNASELVSGTTDRVHLYGKFSKAVECSLPGTIEKLRKKAEDKMVQQKKPSFWESIIDARVGGFKFSF